MIVSKRSNSQSSITRKSYQYFQVLFGCKWLRVAALDIQLSDEKKYTIIGHSGLLTGLIFHTSRSRTAKQEAVLQVMCISNTHTI